jgi:hypothetical protein
VPRRYFVRSDPHHIIDTNPPDSRSSYYTFAWRGFASKSDLDKVARILDKQSNDIARATREGNIEDAEWQIAPIVLYCQRATEQHLAKRSFWRIMSVAVIFLSLVYGGVLWWVTRPPSQPMFGFVEESVKADYSDDYNFAITVGPIPDDQLCDEGRVNRIAVCWETNPGFPVTAGPVCAYQDVTVGEPTRPREPRGTPGNEYRCKLKSGPKLTSFRPLS